MSATSTAVMNPFVGLADPDPPSSTSIAVMNTPVGLADPVTAQRRRAMLDLINRLRNTGVQREIDLPMIAVVGSQSAGKSSLIESISGITLPRSAGTCTRCPTECRLTNADVEWTCSVKLYFVTQGRPRIVPFGDAITTRVEVEERIRRAQQAILNPKKNPEGFLNGTEASNGENELTFSKSYVSLEISGRELADLSFVDLPGLIASVSNTGSTMDIELVKSLVISYVEKESCLVLLTVTCETDYENQGAPHLVKQYDPEGRRTVGVLTKPDRISSGDEQIWLQLIRNEAEPLLNNWFCVKQPDTQELRRGITWEGARQQEDNWFSSNAPWNHLDQHNQMLLRTCNLTDRLSSILAELIAKKLPEIQDDLYSAIARTEQELSNMPGEPSGNPVGQVLRVVGEFRTELYERLKGTPGKDGVVQRIRKHSVKFKREIRKTAPEFVPWRKQDAHRSLPAAGFLSNEEIGSPDDDEVVQRGHLPPSIRSIPSSDCIYIDEVMEKAQDARTRELPDNYPFLVQLGFMDEFVEKWKNPSLAFFDAVYDILKKEVEELVNKHFAQMGRGMARQSVLMIAYDHLDEAARRTKDRVEWLITLESRPQTSNLHYFRDYREKFISFYKLHKHSENSASKFYPHVSPAVHSVISGLAGLGIHAKPEDLPKLLAADPMEAALWIMASVRAYFQVAFKRFVDMVPMAIDQEAVFGLERGLEDALLEGLQLTGPDAHERCTSMLQEAPAIVSKRTELQTKLERLKNARSELWRLSL